MWTMLLPYLADSPFAYPLYILILALGIVVVGRLALGLIPNDATDSPIYRHMRMAVILVTSILAFMTVSLAVVLYALTAFGRPPASPPLESFEENPARREHQPRHSNQRYADNDDGGDEYGAAVRLYAQIVDQCGGQENPGEDNENLLHPLQFLEPPSAPAAARFQGWGRLRAFAGNGGVTQFGGNHNRAILPGAG